jgi:integrase
MGRPLHLDNFSKRFPIPTLEKAKLQWHGWHAFRRGLATKLNALGIDDKTIQTILRHSRISTTQNIYINIYVKGVPESSQSAMEKFDKIAEQMRNEVSA